MGLLQCEGLSGTSALLDDQGDRFMSHIDYTLRIRRTSQTEKVYAVEATISGHLATGAIVTGRVVDQFSIDQSQLYAYIIAPETYSEYLTTALFSSEALRMQFTELCGIAKGGNNVHLRLDLDPDDEDLHSIAWEHLQHPQTKQPLVYGSNVWFSRQIVTRQIEGFQRSERPDLHALAVIANPRDITTKHLFAPIDTAAEQRQLHTIFSETLVPIKLTVLARNGGAGLPTLAECKRQLQHTPVQILYLVCHGYRGEELGLLLEDDEGNTAPINVTAFVEALSVGRPLLVFLASCSSSGEVHYRHFSALGPRLASAGIPAVIGMQDPIAIKTLQEIVPLFFTQLVLHGNVLRALASARAVLARGERQDNGREWWKPALLLQIPDGQLWVEWPGCNELRQALADHFQWHHGHEPDANEVMRLALLMIKSRALHPDQLWPLIGNLRESSEGLQTLLQHIFSTEGDTSLVQHIDEQIMQIPAMRRVLPWSRLLRLRQILGDGRPSSEVQGRAQQAYYLAHPDRHNAPILDPVVGSETPLWWMAHQLASYPGGKQGVPPVLAYAHALLNANLPAQQRTQLQDWCEGVAAQLGLAPQTVGAVALAAPPAMTAPSLLLILEGVEQDPDRVTVKIWFAHNRTDAHQWKRVRSLEPAESWSVAAMGEPITQVVDRIFNMFEFDVTCLRVEVALPCHLLFYPVDQIELADLDDPEPWGIRQPLVVRSSERLLSPKAAVRANWEQRWQKWHQDDAKSLWLRTAIDCGPESIGAELRADAETKRICCVIGCHPLATAVQTAVARRLSNQGVPIVLWYRAAEGLDATQERDMLKLLQHPDLLQYLYELRCKAHATNTGLGRHLTLWWDDPDQPPHRRINPQFTPLS